MCSRAGSLRCVRDHAVVHRDSAATMMAGDMKVNVTGTPSRSAWSRHARRRELVHELLSRRRERKRHRLLKGLRVAKHCLSNAQDVATLWLKYGVGWEKRTPPGLITGARWCCDNLLTLSLTSGECRAYKPSN